METDNEKRRVAAALREYATFDCEDEGEEECLVDCSDWGERVLNLLGCGDTESECYAALADLIEPDTTMDTTKSPELTTKCDRDALLALADEMEFDGAGSLDDDDWCKPLLVEYARRIREACGATQDD